MILLRHPIAVTGLLLACMASVSCQTYEPTADELREREREQFEYCQDMREELDSLRDKPLRRATTQERYNKECLGKTYPEPGSG